MNRIIKIKDILQDHDGVRAWYAVNGSLDLRTTLMNLDAVNPDWCRWLFTRLMTREQCIEIAVFSAEQVVGEYERKYGSNDPQPRNAIDAAKAVLKSDTKENREKAYAAYAAAAAYYAAYYAAGAAYYAANAAAYAAAANAADAAANAANAAMRHRIITEAVRILAVKPEPKLKLPGWW
jgi:hypothetical protein